MNWQSSFLADLHQHSCHAYATSPHARLVPMAHWASLKGLSVIGTGDFTHPAWMEELQSQLISDQDTGLYRLKSSFHKTAQANLPSTCPLNVRFMLQVEVSCVYCKNDRTYKIHHLIYAKTFQQAQALTNALKPYGKLESDGRPTLKLDSRNLLEIVLNTSEDMFLVPAHIWTPWFSILGNRSGFDSIDSCFEDLTEHVHAVESGLSADPTMIRLVRGLDRYQIISSSDAHSPSRLGREATVFHCERHYDAIRQGIEFGTGLVGTLEFFPPEGKYYHSGHRKCGILARDPIVDGRIMDCPKCHQPFTMGVLDRVRLLSDASSRHLQSPPHDHQVGLEKIISELSGLGPSSKKVQQQFRQCIERLGTELIILHQIPIKHIAESHSPSLARAIEDMRADKVDIEPGFDGQYGHLSLGKIHERH